MTGACGDAPPQTPFFYLKGVKGMTMAQQQEKLGTAVLQASSAAPASCSWKSPRRGKPGME